MTLCQQQALRVTAALLEALGVPKQVGLPTEVCVARLLDVEAFMRSNGAAVDTQDSMGRTKDKLHRKRSSFSKTGSPDTTS